MKKLRAFYDFPNFEGESLPTFCSLRFPDAKLDELFGEGETHNVAQAMFYDGRAIYGVRSPRTVGNGRNRMGTIHFFGDLPATDGEFEVVVSQPTVNGREVPVTMPREMFKSVPAIGDDPNDFVPEYVCSHQGFPVTMQYTGRIELIEFSAAIQRWALHFVAVDRTDLSGIVFVTIATHAVNFDWECVTFLSSVDQDDETRALQLKDFQVSIKFPYSDTRTELETDLEDGALYAGGAFGMTGRALAHPKNPPPVEGDARPCDETDDAEMAETSGQTINWPDVIGRPVMRPHPAELQGHWGATGVLYRDDSLPIPSFWRDQFRGTAMRPNVGGTGDHHNFGETHHDAPHVPAKLQRQGLLAGTLYELQRQVHHRSWIPMGETMGVEPWRADGSSTTYNSTPHPSYTRNMLSFPPRSNGSKWPLLSPAKPHDEAHMTKSRIGDAIALVDSELPYLHLFHDYQCVISGIRARRGQTRSVGRVCSALQVMARWLEGTDQHVSIQGFAQAKINALADTYPHAVLSDRQVSPSFVCPGTIDRDNQRGYARYVPDFDQVTEGFQNALALMGVFHVKHGERMDREFVRVAESICVDYYEPIKIADQIVRWEVWYTIGWNDDGSTVDKVHGKTAWNSSSHGAFASQMAVCAAIVLEHSDNVYARERAADILRTIPIQSWSDARWLGSFQGLAEA